MNIGLDGGSKKKTSRPINEKPKNNKGNKAIIKAENQTTRTSQKAEQCRKQRHSQNKIQQAKVEDFEEDRTVI